MTATTLAPTGLLPLEERREIAEEWARALESGRFAQGFGGVLHEHNPDGADRFCALGVLAEVLVERGLLERDEVLGRDRRSMSGFYVYRVPEDQTSSGRFVIPDATLNRIGRSFAFTPVDALNPIAWSIVNDVDRAPFPEIAKMVRERLIPDLG